MIATIVVLLISLVAIGSIGALRLNAAAEPFYRVTVPDPDEPHASL